MYIYESNINLLSPLFLKDRSTWRHERRPVVLSAIRGYFVLDAYALFKKRQLLNAGFHEFAVIGNPSLNLLFEGHCVVQKQAEVRGQWLLATY